MHGVVLVGTSRLDVEMRAVYRHCWGERDWWSEQRVRAENAGASEGVRFLIPLDRDGDDGVGVVHRLDAAADGSPEPADIVVAR